MCANARVETNARDNRLCIKTFYLGVCIQLVEITYAQRKIGIGEQFDCFRLLHSHKESINIFFDCAFLQQSCKLTRLFFKEFHVRKALYGFVLILELRLIDDFGNADNDSRRIKIVVQSL